MRRRALAIATALLMVVSGLVLGATPAAAAQTAEQKVERYLDAVRDDPARLHAFLRELPKGGDIHTHLSGAASMELLIRLAAQDDMCIHRTSHVAANGPCTAQQRPASDAVTDPAFRAEVIGAWSMEGFRSGQGESGHDHFFDAFGKFGAVTGAHRPEMLAEVVDKAARQNELYMETMTTRQGGPVFALSQKVAFDPDFAAMRRQALAGGEMARIVAAARAETDSDETEYRRILKCGTAQAARGCDLTLRYLHQVNRNSDPNVAFTYMVYGFELAEADGRTVGLNLVAPEDGEVAVRDYRLHMRMLNYLRGVYRKAHITLHAGELVPGLVKPEELRYHIREAVLVGHAERIGHGVDITHEDDWREFLATMASRHVMVESPLTSNDQILQVSGWEHPFPLYRRAGVPITLATDDEGISRIDLTHEYQRAVTSYDLRYRDLKTLARTALDHAFLAGGRLWRGPDDHRAAPPCASDTIGSPHPSASCQALLDSSPKAALQWRLEAMFIAFEQRYASTG